MVWGPSVREWGEPNAKNLKILKALRDSLSQSQVHLFGGCWGAPILPFVNYPQFPVSDHVSSSRAYCLATGCLVSAGRTISSTSRSGYWSRGIRVIGSSVCDRSRWYTCLSLLSSIFSYIQVGLVHLKGHGECFGTELCESHSHPLFTCLWGLQQVSFWKS
jgi:hypothetical protein